MRRAKRRGGGSPGRPGGAGPGHPGRESPERRGGESPGRPGRRSSELRQPHPPTIEPALSLRHPATWAAAAIAAFCLVISASYVLYDTDLWSLLAVGKAIWARHALPTANQWAWPSWGEPWTPSSWLFRALLWPLWSAGGVAGLFAWRWISTLATFTLLWAAARCMGARGPLALVVMVWCGLVYRLRTDVRPETLAAVLLALTIWILEARRSSGRDRSAWLVPIALLWANVHVSYYLGFVLIGAHLLGDRGRPRRKLWIVALAALAVSFLNPGGWRTLAQPFQFALSWRDDPLFRTIGELHPVPWRDHLRSGLPILMLGWPLLAWRRARRKGLDLVELLLCGSFTWIALSSQRFLGVYALAAAPFLARDLELLVGGAQWLPRAAWTRALAAATLCVLISIPEWTRRELPLGVALDPTTYPERACDFMAEHGVRGRGFNHLHFGGYQSFRFWPERERQPLVSTQPEDIAPALRRDYVRAFGDFGAWQELDRRYEFDYALLDRRQDPGDFLLDFLDRDSTWALVFSDDAAVLAVKRRGTMEPVARRFAYRTLPMGREALGRLLVACVADPRLRADAGAELRRMEAGSPLRSFARRTLALLDRMDAAR